jgi:hypothetical protein
MDTMAADPYVYHLPPMTGGVGTEAVRSFYGRHFIGKWPDDIEITPVSRTIGADQVVDELIISFTHDIEMDAILPDVAPTGRQRSPGRAPVRFGAPARSRARGARRRRSLRARGGRGPDRTRACVQARALGVARAAAVVDVVGRRVSLRVPLGDAALRLNLLVRHDRRREIVIALLTVVWLFNVSASSSSLLPCSLTRRFTPADGSCSSAAAYSGSPTRSLSDSPSGNSTAEARSPARSQQQHASRTSSSPKTRTRN